MTSYAPSTTVLTTSFNVTRDDEDGRLVDINVQCIIKETGHKNPALAYYATSIDDSIKAYGYSAGDVAQRWFLLYLQSNLK